MFYRESKKLNVKTSLLGFGCMRFPLLEDGTIDEEQTFKMFDIIGINVATVAIIIILFCQKALVANQAHSQNTFTSSDIVEWVQVSEF